MNKIISAAFLSSFLAVVPLAAQQTTPQTDDDVVKVSTSLVQVDAVVTDKNGIPVTNLTANDFEILQDGKPQKITNLAYVSRKAGGGAAKQSQTAADNKPGKTTPLPPVIAIRSPEFGRILTFIVDDGGCDATSAGIGATRSGLEKFINEQMQPNDSVAIYQTRAGSSLLQQYTSDKTRLLSIAKKIRWYPPNGLCNIISGKGDEPANNDGTLKSGVNFENDRDKAKREGREDYTRDRQVTSLIGVMRYVINGLRDVGGRKILFLMADSLPISNGKVTLPNAFDAARDLTEQANRAAVVINTIDIRRLSVPMADAADSFGVKEDVNAVDKVLAGRAANDDTRQSGLFYAANETGGKFYKNMNLLNVPIEKALQSETGYYLIGYQPEEETFKGKKFHKIEIKLKRPDLIGSSRSGFYGITDSELRPKPRTGDSELYNALSAPLPNADLGIQLSAYFVNTPDKGNFIHATLYIDGKDIMMVGEADGKKKVVFDTLAVTLDEKNKVVDDTNHTVTLHIPPDKIEQIQQNGLVYTVDVPVKNDGVYTFRTALRDASAKRIGSASQVIEVPNLKKDRLFLSGLIISGVDANGKIYPPDTAKADNDFSTVVSKAIPAIRQFRRNSIIGYAYTIYDAKINPATNQPNLTIQTNLYRDGKLMSEGQPRTAEIEKQADMTRIRDYSYLRLNPNVPIGDYTLQIIIKDTATGKVANQSVDFEVVE